MIDQVVEIGESRAAERAAVTARTEEVETTDKQNEPITDNWGEDDG